MMPTMPKSNPVTLLMQAALGQPNPMAALEKAAMGNPQVAQAMQIIRGKSSTQLQTIAENMAKERGTSVNDVLRQLGINNASFR